MKLNYWGKFVDDNDHFAKYDVDDSYKKLIVTLVNKLNIFKGEICDFNPLIRWNKIDYIRALNEYLNYNVDNFDDFTITDKLIDIGCGDIKMPINILKSLDDNCEYRMVVVGKPGEINYLLKENRTLLDCVNNNQGLISFSIKTGEDLYFMKNYINSDYYIREEYNPGRSVRIKLFKLERMMEYENVNNKNVCTSSAFDHTKILDYNYLIRQFSVEKQEDGTYEIDTRDVDGRPVSCETRDGDSLYSVYYQYMVEKGYFKEKSFVKIKK